MSSVWEMGWRPGLAPQRQESGRCEDVIRARR
jgi:hypothetical protein